MLKEDYCSYEVAKLLKEKGFNELCFRLVREDGDIVEAPSQAWNGMTKKQKAQFYLCPTHQMAMKWLREKGIHMSIDTVISSSGNIYFNIDTYSEDSGWNHPVDFYDSYEEAVEAALKYALENLI